MNAIEKNKGIEDKSKVIDLYYDFKEEGLYASDHFIYDFMIREFDKKGNRVLEFEKVVEIAKSKPNLIDIRNGRDVVAIDGINIVLEEGKCISIRRGKVSKHWKKI